MNELSPLLSFLLGLAAFAGLWLAMCILFNRLSGMPRRLEVDTGPVLRASRWGDAKINRVSWENCVRVVECVNGWLIQGHWLAGGGQLWLPRAQTRVGELQGIGELRGTHRLLEAGTDRVKLEGELAEFVA
jgi:hypothetical protein